MKARRPIGKPTEKRDPIKIAANRLKMREALISNLNANMTRNSKKK